MEENKFGKTSRLSIRTRCDGGKTVLEDVSFTAPYKIMTPFPEENGGISVMPLCASAGIMEGDRQEFSFHIGEGSRFRLLSQSFDKIHKMKAGKASRIVNADVARNSVFYYYPQPVIPYRDSAFESIMEFHLEDESARLFLLEIICCGRSASEERFAYRKFASHVMIYRGTKLIYRDNTRYIPQAMPMEGLGMYEGYTHMANIFITGSDEETQEKIWEILDNEPDCEGGVTKTAQGDLAVRIFGRRGQKLQEIADKIKEGAALEEKQKSKDMCCCI